LHVIAWLAVFNAQFWTLLKKVITVQSLIKKDHTLVVLSVLHEEQWHT